MIETKYEDYKIPKEIIETDNRRLIHQIWKLIPMRENEENWQEHLKCLIAEIIGLNNLILQFDINFLVLISKLEGLTSVACDDFMVFRKTVFKCINLLSRCLKNVK